MTDAVDARVPPDESPRECPDCGRPFRRERYLTLHRGLEHYDALDADERAAFEDAYDEEDDAVRFFRLKAVGTLLLLYFGMLFTYSVVT